MLELDVTIEKLDDNVIIPLGNNTGVQVRSDGVLLDGKLHLWEEILLVTITNRGLIKSLKKNLDKHY